MFAHGGKHPFEHLNVVYHGALQQNSISQFTLKECGYGC